MIRSYMKFAGVVFFFAKWLTILIMTAMTISVLTGVFFRYVIPMPMAWPPEAARFLMVAVTMFGSAVAIRRLDHVGITFVVDALPRSVRTAIYCIGVVLTAAFLIVFIIFSTRMTLEMGPRQQSSSLGVSMAVAYVAMPLGGLAMLVQLGAVLIEALARTRAGGSPFAEEAGESGLSATTSV